MIELRRKKIVFPVASIILLVSWILSIPAAYSDVNDWDGWQKSVNSALTTWLQDLKRKHQEFATLPDEPYTVGFEVTKELKVANVKAVNFSPSKNFDGLSTGILLFTSGEKVYAFPPNASDKFVRCKVSFFPSGKVSPVLVTHPNSHEVFEEKNVLRLESTPHAHSFPPDIGGKR